MTRRQWKAGGRLAVYFCAVLVGLCSLKQAWAQGSDSYQEGQKIEVREGDKWSPATVLTREGHRYQILYSDGTTDWLGTDRMRRPESAAATTSPAATEPSKTPPKIKPALEWKPGHEVEIKWGGLWSPGTVVRLSGQWVLVKYTQGSTSEWVEPWRVREKGSQEDSIGFARPNKLIPSGRSEPPPAGEPAPAGPGKWPTGQAGGPSPDDPLPGSDDPAFVKFQFSLVPAAERSISTVATAIKPDGELPGNPAPHELRVRASNSELALKSFALARGATVAAVGAVDRVWRGSNKTLEVEKIDLLNGQSLGKYILSDATQIADISPDGKNLAVYGSPFEAGTPWSGNRLEVWSLAGTKALRTRFFVTPTVALGQIAERLSGARFLDDDHLLIFSSKKIVLWKLSEAKAEYTREVDGTMTPVLSPGGKQVMVTDRGDLTLLDALTGTVLGQLRCSDRLDDGLFPAAAGGLGAFSPTGKQFTLCYGRSVRSWEVETGELTREFGIEGLNNQVAEIQGVGDGYVLLGMEVLVDLEHRVALWNYTTHGVGAMGPGGRCYYLSDTGNGTAVLSWARLPHPDALAVANTLKSDELMVIRPGIKVSVSVNIGTPDERKKLLDRITNKLAVNQMTVADGQPVEIRVDSRPGKTEEKTYSKFGSFSDKGQKVQVPSTITSLTITCKGAKAWTSESVSSAPPYISLPQGQTIDQYVQDAARPYLADYAINNIPRYLAFPKDPLWYGQSPLPSGK